MKSNKRLKQPGFTLVELLITMTIFSVVSIAVYATFNSGMSVWRRAKEVNAEERMFLLRVEKLSRELRGSFISGDIPFSLAKNKIQFSSVIDSDISRIIYSFDENKKALLRSSDKLASILAADKKELEPEFLAFLSPVDTLSFSCLYFDLQKNSYAWKEEWPDNYFPIAVKVSMTSKDKTYAATIIIPAA